MKMLWKNSLKSYESRSALTWYCSPLINDSTSGILCWTDYSSTYCSSFHNYTMKGSFQVLRKVDSCLKSSISSKAIPKACQYPFEPLKYPFLRQSMPRMERASWLITMGRFCYSFPVMISSDSNTVRSWDPLFTTEIYMGSAPLITWQQ